MGEPTQSHRGGSQANWLRRSISILIVVCLGWYVWHARRQLVDVFKLDPRFLLPMILVPLASLAVNGLIGRELAAEFGVQLSVIEWYGLAVINALGNYLPMPQSGAVARAVYLKRVHGLTYVTYAATLVVTYVSAVALYGCLGLIGLTIFATIGRPAPLFLWVTFAILAGSMVFFTRWVRFLPIPEKLAGVRTHVQSLHRRGLLRRIVCLQTLLVSLTTTGLWLACQTLPHGHAVSWPTALMLGLMILASGIVNVTPGNVGVEQGIAELSARLLQLPPNVGFLASVIFRAVSVMTILVIGPFFAALLMRISKRVPEQLSP